MNTEDTGLEKVAAKTPAVITTPEEYRGALLRWQSQHFNVLTPFANISGLAPQHGLVTSLVQINTDKLAGQVYDGLPFLKKDEVALAKNGLRMIAEGLGISTKLEYVSVGTIRHYWNVKAIASYRGIDGGTVVREAGMEWDLRDGSDRLKGWTANQISEARKHGLRACETRAINAVIRECGCGVLQAYKREQLAKPFVALRVAFQVDPKNAEQMRIVTERALGSTNAMYPASHRELPPIDADVVDDDAPDEPRHVGRGASTQASAPATTASAKPAEDLPPCEGAVKIVDIASKSGETRGKKWTRYTITDSNGVVHSTFDKQHFDDAERFKASNTWVEIAEETDGQYTNLLEITKAGTEPPLPGLGEL